MARVFEEDPGTTDVSYRSRRIPASASPVGAPVAGKGDDPGGGFDPGEAFSLSHEFRERPGFRSNRGLFLFFMDREAEKRGPRSALR